MTLVYNGEIYNHQELRADLRARGHEFRSYSDTEVLLAMYVEFGQHMLPMLNGIFALAVFDEDRDELLLARDALGVKPLCFTQSPAGFAFASELKALLRLLPVPPELDITALYRYVSFMWCPGTGTPFKAVSRLGPGELLQVRDGRILNRRHWAQGAFDAPNTACSAASAAMNVRSALRTAVHRQLVADVPVGAFLSGGLDSSAVVAFAREKVPKIDCFTIAPDRQDDGDTSDLPYARRVAKHLGVPLHEVNIDSARMASDLEKMVYLLDEPLADPAALNVLYISQLARSHGIKVLLSGAGGDDLFTGYRRHRALAAERWWSWLPTGARRRLRHGAAALASRGVAGHGAGGSIVRRIGKAFAHADESANERLVGYFLWFDSLSIRNLFAAEHRPGLSSTSLAAPATEYLSTLPHRLAPLERMLALEQRFFLGDHNLPYTDRMSMAAGVEVRVPFLDPDLLTLANSLPPALKQHGRHGKWILKQAMEPLLPQDVIYRPKTGFGAPLRRWLRGELSEFVNDVLSPAGLRRRGIFDTAAVSDLVDRNRKGQIDAAYPIFALLCIELWCRHFVDGHAAYADHYQVPEVRGSRQNDERPSQMPSESRVPHATSVISEAP